MVVEQQHTDLRSLSSFLGRGWGGYATCLQVTFQTVLVKPIFSEGGETVEQAPGFNGAFFHGLERIAPDVEEAKGEFISRFISFKFSILDWAARLGVFV